MINKIIDLIKQGENISVEFKKCSMSVSSSVYETVCSFLNRYGGDILLGVLDSGEIAGVAPENVSSMKKDFANTINNSQKLTPTFYATLTDYVIDGKVVLHVHIPESANVHRCCGRIYDRNEDGDYDVTDNTQIVADMYIRKQHTYTENRIFPCASMEDLRTDLISRARIMAANNRAGAHPWMQMTDVELMKSANLIIKDMSTGIHGITLAGILIFGKDTTILSALPHHRTDAILRIINIDRYDDRDDIRTNLIESYDRLRSFVRKHLNDVFYLESDIRVSLLDKISREIVVNMLIHREYSNAYPAKLIIENNKIYTENANRANGIGEIDINDFTPYPKNPVIARFFKEIGYADELGSGIRNTVKYTQLYSGAVPVFEEGNVFKTYIPNIHTNVVVPSNLRPESGPESGPESRPESRPESTLAQEILLLLKLGALSKAEIAKALGNRSISSGLKKQIKNLLNAGLIEMTIPDKPQSRLQKYKLRNSCRK